MSRTIAIFGNGRIASAAAYYCDKRNVGRPRFVRRASEAEGADLIIGALAGELGEQCVKTALKYGISLIDISDVDPPFYLKNKKRIADSGIMVVPGCGFAPGLVNCILGREMARHQRIDSVEVSCGSLSRKKSYFPFLWCFEDLVLEHRIPSFQLIRGRTKKFSAFADFRHERFGRIEAESYYCASGFENLLDGKRIGTFTTRVIRPAGFKDFFTFMMSYGYFDTKNLLSTKAALEAAKEDNTTLARITVRAGGTRTIWKLESFSRAKEALNSMQKITASVPAVMAEMLLEGALPFRGLVFMDALGAEPRIFNRLLAGVRREGISVRC